MCGIAGYFGTDPPPADRVDRCLRLMHRRGPDAAASFRFTTTNGRHAVLLNTRLSIIDLDVRSNPPFRVGSHVLVYNGELYNYVELRKELAARGQQFRTESDTEVLLRALIEFGPDGLDRCEGMWAFAVLNEADGSLLLSRDRFGEKPLYLFRDATGLFFGSEIKFLAALRGRSFDVNHAHLYRYLVNGYKALYKTGEAFFHGVSELLPATVLKIDAEGRETSARYWSPEYAPVDGMTYNDAVEQVREALIRAVKLRLRADVPLAFCMSGGVDSNALISTAKRLCGYDVHGFTVMSDDARYEERDQIDAAVRELGVRHTPIPITADRFRENMVELVRQHDAPVYTISYYIHWLLMSEVAREGYRIAISGTGADELFTGYYDHHNLYLYEVRDRPEFESALAGWNRHIAPLVRNPYLQKPRLYFENAGIREHIYLDARNFAGFLQRDWHEAFAETAYAPSLLRNRMLNELFHEAVPVILHEDDLNAMYFSIENRSPFLDRGLFQLACQIPSRFLVRDGYAKIVLRDAMRGIVPDAVLDNRRKVGFNAPVTSFLKIDQPDVREYLLAPGPVFDHVRRDKIEELLGPCSGKGSDAAAQTTLPNSQSKFLFYFLNAKVFLEEFGSHHDA
jgi:asparagine synthase (glutamine-hydrolysing)